MRVLAASLTLSVIATPSFAALVGKVPEMNAGAGVAAIALVAGAIAILRERKKNK